VLAQRSVFVREGFFLVNQEDIDPYNASEPGLYDRPPTLVRPDRTPKVNVRLPPECNLAETATCRPDLDACLLSHPEGDSKDVMCTCFYEHALCYVNSGCREALPDSVVEFCFNTIRCRRTLCDGSSASSVGVSGLLLLLVVAVSWQLWEQG
jgi:hypothetical protein